MKLSAIVSLLVFSLSAFATSGPSDQVRIALDTDIPKIVLDSSMGRMEESCTSNSEGSDSCHSYYVKEYSTYATIDLKVNASDIDLKGQTVVIDFTGEKATAITNRKNDLYFEIDIEKKTEEVASRRRTFSFKMTLTPRLQSKTLAAMKMEKVKIDGDVISFETLPETGVEMKTDMAVSEKKLLFYSLVWWKELLTPVIEVAPLEGKLIHRVHVREISEIRAGEKYRFDLYRSTKKDNSLGKFTSARLKSKM
jgi:hypothetical protein